MNPVCSIFSMSARVLLCAVLLLACVFPAAAQNGSQTGRKMDAVVWSGLFLASSDAISDGREISDPAHRALVERMGKIGSLRFDHYRLLGEHSQNLLKDYETWLVPGQEIYFKLDLRGTEPDGGLRVAVQLWRDKQVVLKTDVVLMKGRPIFIRGPKAGAGYLILALQLKA